MIVIIVIMVAVALASAGLAAGLTVLYWRRRYGRLQQQSHLQQVRNQVNSGKQAKVMQSKLDFLHGVLGEVQCQHEGMTSYLKLLMSDDINPTQTEWKMACDHMKKRASVLTEMVNGTLEIMHYEKAADIKRDDEVQVNAFCQDVFDGCTPHLSGKVDLRLETQLDDDVTIRTNMKALQCVLANLIRCSMQYTHEGEIVLSLSRDKHRQLLVFTVSDTGLGIPEEAKEIAFERMTDTDITNNIVVVRLRLCKALVKLLGGSIYLDPTRERGTAVVFTIKESC